MIKSEQLSYRYIAMNGRYHEVSVTYELLFKNKKLIKIYNENGHSVENGSECFNHFKSKYP